MYRDTSSVDIYIQHVGGWTATEYTMLDLHILPMTSAHN